MTQVGLNKLVKHTDPTSDWAYYGIKFKLKYFWAYYFNYFAIEVQNFNCIIAVLVFELHLFKNFRKVARKRYWNKKKWNKIDRSRNIILCLSCILLNKQNAHEFLMGHFFITWAQML